MGHLIRCSLLRRFTSATPLKAVERTCGVQGNLHDCYAFVRVHHATLLIGSLHVLVLLQREILHLPLLHLLQHGVLLGPSALG